MRRIQAATMLFMMLAGGASAQQPPAAGPADGAAQPKGAAAAGGTSDFANQQTYKMKDGGMYQPPAQRPASPAQDVSIYGRT